MINPLVEDLKHVLQESNRKYYEAALVKVLPLSTGTSLKTFVGIFPREVDAIVRGGSVCFDISYHACVIAAGQDGLGITHIPTIFSIEANDLEADALHTLMLESVGQQIDHDTNTITINDPAQTYRVPLINHKPKKQAQSPLKEYLTSAVQLNYIDIDTSKQYEYFANCIQRIIKDVMNGIDVELTSGHIPMFEWLSGEGSDVLVNKLSLLNTLSEFSSMIARSVHKFLHPVEIERFGIGKYLFDEAKLFKYVSKILNQHGNNFTALVSEKAITSPSDLSKLIRKSYRLPSFNTNNLIKTLLFQSQWTVNDPKKLVGMSLLPIDRAIDNHLLLINPDLIKGTHIEGSLSALNNQFVGGIYWLIADLGGQVVQSHYRGESKDHRRKLIAPFRCIFNSNDIVKSIYNWKIREDLEALPDSRDFMDQLFKDIIMGVMAYSDGFDRNRINQCFPYMGVDSYFERGLFAELLSDNLKATMGVNMGANMGDESRLHMPLFEANRDIAGSVKDLAKFSSKVHRVYMPRAQAMLNDYYQSNSVPTLNEWTPFIDHDVVLGDGTNLVCLNSRSALVDEGEKMQHCVGTYYQRAIRGECYCLSLRDSAGQSIATLEIRYDNSGHDEGKFMLCQMQGKNNKKTYSEQNKAAVDTFLEDLNKGVYSVNLDTDGKQLMNALVNDPMEFRYLMSVVPTQNLHQMNDAIALFDEALPHNLSFKHLMSRSKPLSLLYENFYEKLERHLQHSRLKRLSQDEGRDSDSRIGNIRHLNL
ncbi:PcfJ domain-containing protein [Photobacterium leiognathi]|uniref:PcfJ domain-containing protein n=1 Tax=Photobacterium leiognathi TaxID=553611 RepID=UPI002982AF23|nr:PcfJ domain-containing protein [Photobacterium leiognathi]